ncbi:alpha-L-fucosidase [Flavivirga spongiicola]|uniref:alpha-L-fucosidase n=1 Tax=Flavivirga spongiicola TaxID=421621 RepID=A0ABU7XNQ3_9FLAO|nr:alpha-L-fucosidase [Flavivirga sp. MEBiC05379]MDO5977394.1 alpha-L-fucosidase [Flavivirga sp. MEBiC05379]
MNKLFQLLIILFVIVSCDKKTGILYTSASTIEISETDTKDSITLKAAHVVPTPNQYEALKNEFTAFIHFGPNTFTREEWGNGMEDPKVFNLQNLDTDQWCKSIVEAGMTMVIITAKHHDGFVLWQSRYTEHGVMSSPFKDGKGDVVKELSESCKKYGLKLGVYLSPADLYQIENPKGLYGNLSTYSDRVIPRPVEGRPFENKTTFTFNVDDYNEYFLNQLFELLTEYGPIHEVWFDGAHPKRKGGQKYNYLAWKELISKLAPEAVVFGKQDVRWCGNESGATRDTEWNIIPYQTNPHEMNSFADITIEDVGSREQLYKAKFLHYQQAETDTSIREGWFYRDDTDQKTRSTDDVYDIYERSVGGNATLLLNIPPNREGIFSPVDVKILKEVGERIKETYGTNLFKGARGSVKVLDEDLTSFELLDGDKNEIIIETKEPITTNRITLQEAITTHSERIEKHAVDAWINNEWQEITTATNVGYKRILRFPEVTSGKFRVRILETRLSPAISNITAHYYKSRPPQLSITRDVNGMLDIQQKKHEFNWKIHGENPENKLKADYEIRYTIDGTNPTKVSKLYKEPFLVNSGEVKAVAINKEQLGSIAANTFGIIKKGWKSIGADSSKEDHEKEAVFDADPNTYWQSEARGGSHYITIDLGKEYTLKGFAYTPQGEHSEGMIEKGIIKGSKDGLTWNTIEAFGFGNLINDPVTRRHYFKAPVSTRYIRIESKVIAGGKKTAAIAELDFFE